MVSNNIQMVTVDSSGKEKEIYPITKAENIKNLVELMKDEFIDLFYPIGCIYTSTSNKNPELLYGGQWIQIKDKFLLSAGDSYSAGSEGGEKSVVLSVSAMPSHTHAFTGSSATTGGQSANHTHSVSITSGSAGAHTHNSLGAPTGPIDNYAGYGMSIVGGYKDRVCINAYTATLSAGAHTHSVSGTSGNQSANHTHTVTAAGTNANTGSGQAHNNMPPYLTVYMWQRVA